MCINGSIYYTNISFYGVVLKGVYFIFCGSVSMTHGVVGLGGKIGLFSEYIVPSFAHIYIVIFHAWEK